MVASHPEYKLAQIQVSLKSDRLLRQTLRLLWLMRAQSVATWRSLLLLEVFISVSVALAAEAVDEDADGDGSQEADDDGDHEAG